MKAHLINNENEFIKAYTYNEDHARKNMPVKFPCILILKNAGGGLGGEYVEHQTFFFPQGTTNKEDYFSGFLVGLTVEE